MNSRILFDRLIPTGTLTRDLKLLCLSNFIGAFGDGLFVYTLPIYLRNLKATPADVGLLYSILTLSSALTVIPGGFLADKIDRKKLMILGWAVWTPAPLMFAVAGQWNQLIPVMFIYGFLISGPAVSAYVATYASKGRMTLTFTTISMSWSLGYIFSPALGGYLSGITGTRLVFFLAFLLYGAAMGTLFFIQSQHPRKPDQPSLALNVAQPTQSKRIISLSIYFATAIFLISLVRPLVVQFLNDVFILNSFYVGVLGSVTFAGWAILSVGLGKIGDRWTKSVAVAAALVLSSLSFALLISFNSIPLLAFASFLNGASYPLWSLMGAAVGSVAPEASRGRWISVSQTLATLTGFAAPYLGGILYESSPYMPFFVVIAAAPLLSLLAFAKPLKET